jgi:hypothetical protein
MIDDSMTESVSRNEISDDEQDLSFINIRGRTPSKKLSIYNPLDDMKNINPHIITKAPPRMTIISNQIVYDIPEEESEWNDQVDVSYESFIFRIFHTDSPAEYKVQKHQRDSS